MSRTFSFNASGMCKKTEIYFDALCVSYGYEEKKVDKLQFFGDLEDAIKSTKTLPDCLVVIANVKLASDLNKFWYNENTQRETIMSRGNKKNCTFIKSYHFYGWDADNSVLADSHQVSAPAYDIPIEQFFQQGLRTLLVNNEAVQIAPAGHTFKHPSGTKNKVFIQAREMAKTEPELHFVAIAICLAMGKELRNVQVAYIDTMGIYHYAREALKAANNNARIESFHSYEDVKKLSRPSCAYVCIISASTSGGMANRLVKKQGFDTAKVLTLIDTTDVDRSGRVMLTLDFFGEDYKKQLASDAETEIEIVGEHFSFKAKPPRSVVLAVPHKPKQLDKFLKHFAIQGMKGFNSKPHAGAANPKLLCLDASPLVGNKDFESWLEKEIVWSVTLAVDHIIHTDDPVSKSLAELAKNIILRHKQLPSALSVISKAELCREHVKPANGVLVISAVAGDGSSLREISRDLREYINTEIPRHFLVAVGLPQTEEAWMRLRQFLEKNPTKRNYGFSNWLYLPIGYDGKDTAWEHLIKLAESADVENLSYTGIAQNIVESSLDQMTNVLSTNHQNLLPKADMNPLALTQGFVFFEDIFKNKLDEVSQSTIYIVISSVLQSAREIKDKNIQLKPTGYESVVLAPECFLRFNDNILQACLLRACHPSELDYSSSSHLSKLMKEFLAKVFARHTNAYGDAALEFAAALATDRLKLKKDDFEELLNTAIKQLKNKPSPLLGLLLKANL